jgi:RNA polymerase sigma-70 factor (ECF subfamily)
MKMQKQEFNSNSSMLTEEQNDSVLIDGLNNDLAYKDLKFSLSSLTPNQKELINLFYFKGYTQEEISKKLGMPVGTVKSKVRQALIILRKLMEN